MSTQDPPPFSDDTPSGWPRVTPDPGPPSFGAPPGGSATPGYGDPGWGQASGYATPGYGQPGGYADPGFGQPGGYADPGYGPPGAYGAPGYPQPYAPPYGGPAPQAYGAQYGYGQRAQISSVGKLFGAYLLDVLLGLVTLYIGWLIWAAITAADGQTPAKRLLGMQVVNADTGVPLDWGTYVFLRGFLGGILHSLVVGFTFYVFAFMPLWDERNQTIAAKVSNSVVVDI